VGTALQVQSAPRQIAHSVCDGTTRGGEDHETPPLMMSCGRESDRRCCQGIGRTPRGFKDKVKSANRLALRRAESSNPKPRLMQERSLLFRPAKPLFGEKGQNGKPGSAGGERSLAWQRHRRGKSYEKKKIKGVPLFDSKQSHPECVAVALLYLKNYQPS